MFERKKSAESLKFEERKKSISQQSSVTDELDKMNKLEKMDVLKEDSKELDPLLDLEDGFNRVRDELIQAKPRVTDMPIPTGLDDHIQKGITKGIKAQKAWRFGKWSTLAACFLLAVFIISARVSPAVASVIHQIPGLGYIVEIINYDKGLQSAVENDFILPLGVSDEHENIVFTVDGLIMDEASLVIFYTVDNKRGEGSVDFSDVKLLDDRGEPLEQVSISHSSLGDPDQDGDGKIQSRINVNFDNHTLIPDQLHLEIKLREISAEEPAGAFTNLSSTWKVIIPVDKEKFAGMKTVYEVNQSVVIEGQRITFEKVTVYPTRMVLDIFYDPANSKKIFYFDDLTLVNEKGEEWGEIWNGISGSRPDDNHDILFFQSNYFTQPQELYLRGKSIRAIDKESTKITLDLEKEKIVEGPSGLVLEQVIKTPLDREVDLIFSLKTNPLYDEQRGFSVFSSEFTDARGNSFNTIRQSTLTHANNSEYNQNLRITIPDNQSYQAPLTFQIQDFPSRIMGEFNIKIR